MLFSERVVLVTGAAGFIGSHVADKLMERGDRVIIVGNRCQKRRSFTAALIVVTADEMNDYYDVRLKQANLEYLFEKFSSQCTVYRGDICNVDFISDVFEVCEP
jgi:UDP-glucuronate 4-epimerase